MHAMNRAAASWAMLVALVSGGAWPAAAHAEPAEDSAKALEKQPSAEHLRSLEQLFTQAWEIRVRYAPSKSLGRGSVDEQAIEGGWKFATSMRCRQPCRAVATSLYDSLASGLRVDRPCPPRLAAAIGFIDGDGKVITTVYLHESLACYKLKGHSFVIRDTRALAEFFERVEELPW